MSEKSDKENVDEFIDNLKKLVNKISPFLGGFIVGIITPRIYNILSDEQKKKWKSVFPIHHGAFGLVTTGISFFIRLLLQALPEDKEYVKLAKKLSEIIMGVGSGLTIEDIKDYNKWFNSELDK